MKINKQRIVGMKKGLRKKTARLFLTYICSVACLCFLSLLCIRVTLANPNFMSKQMENSRYTKLVQQEINEKIQDIGRGSNVPENQLKEIVSLSFVQTNVKKYVTSLYMRKTYDLSGEEEIKEKIQQHLNHYIQTKNIQVTKDKEQVINRLVDSSIEATEKSLEIPFLANYVNKVKQFKPLLNQLIIGNGVILVCLLLLLLHTIHWSHQKFRFVALMFLGAGGTLLLLPTWIYFSGVIDRIGILTESVYYFVRGYLLSFVQTFIYAGILAVVMAIGMYVISEIKRKVVINKGRAQK